MKRVWTYLRWGMLVLGGVFFLFVVGVGLFTQTARFREILREQLVGTLNTTFQGQVSLERIEGSIWGHVILHNLTLRYQEVDIFQVPRLTVSYAVLPLLQGRVEVSQVEGVDPVLRLKQDAAGNWNILEALSSPGPEPAADTTTESGLAVLLDTVTLHRAHIDLSLSGENEQLYHLTETSLDTRIDLLPTGTEIEIRRLATRFIADGLPPVQAEAVLTYQDTTVPASVRVQTLQLTTQYSRLQLTGAISNLDTLDTQATLLIDNLAAAEVAQLVPGSPLREDVSGKVEVAGPLADFHTQLALAAAEAQVSADFQADLSQEPPRYTGTLTLAQLDLQKLIEVGDLAGVLDGTVQASGVGASLPDLNGEANLQMTGVQVGGWQIGHVSFTGSVAQQRGKVDGQVSGGLGQASWHGEIHLTEEPRYELTLSATHLDLKKVAAGEESVTGQLNVNGTLKGKGLKLPEMDAQAEIALLPSTLGPVEMQHGSLRMRLAEGRLTIAEGTLTAQDATLTLQGEIGTALDEAGQLSYALRVDQLSPWLSLAGQQGSGAITLTGEARGNVADLQVQGELQADRLQVQGVALHHAALTYDLSEIGQEQPSGTLTIGLKDLRAGVALQTVEATVILPQEQPRVAHIAMQAQDTAGHTHRLKTEVAYQPERLAVHLSELSLEQPEGVWQLAQPTAIVQKANDITIERLLITNRDQQIVLDGNVSLTGAQGLRLQIDRFAVAALRPLFPQTPEVAGLFSAQVQLTGTATDPDLAGTLRLTDLRVAGQAYAGLSTTVAYKDQRARLALTFQQDATHTLRATGTLPVAVQWAEGWNARILGDLDCRVHSAGLNLAFLNALSGPAVREVAGELNLDMLVQGPVSHPLPKGTFQLRDGRATVDALGVTVSTITVAGTVDPEQIRIEQISAKARKGQLQGSGVIAMHDYLPEKVTVSLTADRWPAIWTRQYKVQIGGQLRAEGLLTAPQVTGRVEVQQATLRPDLAFLDAKPVTRDDTIVIVPTEGSVEQPTGATATEPQPPPQPDVFQNLALDLTVLVHRNTQVKHPNAEVELAGEVQAKKRRGEDLRLTGVIETVRGWAGFQGRRFTLSQGQVEFSGDKEINPELDMVAQYSLPDYLVEALVGGTAAEPTLHLQSDPPLEQADILAVLLFGKPASALGRGEQVDLQQQALALTSGYAAARIGESVSQALGLDQLGIDLQEVDFTGGRVGFGRYLTPNTRISASQDLAGRKGREVSIEYQLAPGWGISTSTSSTGSSGADIIWRKQY